MEYAEDDLRPPNFFIEEQESTENLLDIDQVIDLSPSKRPRLDHTNKGMILLSLLFQWSFDKEA